MNVSDVELRVRLLIAPRRSLASEIGRRVDTIMMIVVLLLLLLLLLFLSNIAPVVVAVVALATMTTAAL